MFRSEELYTAKNYQSLIATFRNNFPSYVYYCPFRKKELISAHLSSIEKTYAPRECLRALANLENRDSLQETALDFITLLSAKSGIAKEDFGLHGSIALSMHSPESDIDIVVYGGENFRKLEKTIAKLTEAGILTYQFKNRLDIVRRFKGQYRGKTFMYNAVRKPEEINSPYGQFKYSPLTFIEFECTVKDDSETMFRPATYRIENYKPINSQLEIEETRIPRQVVSMIGCYRNVARQSDKIRVLGMLEQVENLQTGKIFCQAVVGTGISEEERICPL